MYVCDRQRAVLWDPVRVVTLRGSPSFVRESEKHENHP